MISGLEIIFPKFSDFTHPIITMSVVSTVAKRIMPLFDRVLVQVI